MARIRSASVRDKEARHVPILDIDQVKARMSRCLSKIGDAHDVATCSRAAMDRQRLPRRLDDA
jgi:hypothetical protein